ncbi:hypothetical protein AMELA_G00002960 [Ameiurus melas]|uniref:Uncharacterized protein n=1 Tax=Ameiurus melas TaxID=219545 RepID=A0A7J6BHD7_AMEME|nr:hypothetical protein AMELA_G00002960 [Ameiurus melas]
MGHNAGFYDLGFCHVTERARDVTSGCLRLFDVATLPGSHLHHRVFLHTLFSKDLTFFGAEFLHRPVGASPPHCVTSV